MPASVARVGLAGVCSNAVVSDVCKQLTATKVLPTWTVTAYCRKGVQAGAGTNAGTP